MSKEKPKEGETEAGRPASAKEERGEANTFKPSPSGESKGITGHDVLGKTRPDLHKAQSKDRGITGHYLLGLK
ncbi:MAG: hypothetical protein ACYDFU_01545 [Nitrospirota bacterium]